ncbi:hypothetical protein FCH28_27265 [Streptomyces piniterrae]|uniref:Uncharacterized protein n=1 Tax=Streptomyces piniterrae TaxID=2571125 RepID=A0A4U0MYB2_9ACTN|nr:hypothetical protein [Streptomyces piniterrae]TJZ46201.1 hypothetical protein FCH28_27265 [Streptomyces piniterrae]
MTQDAESIDRQQLMEEALQEFASRSDDQLDWMLGIVRHRLGAARRMGVDIPGDLAERVARLSEKRGWPVDQPQR